MKQMTLATGTGFELHSRAARGDVFLTNAPRHEQSIQGGELAAFLKRSGALT